MGIRHDTKRKIFIKNKIPSGNKRVQIIIGISENLILDKLLF